MKRKRISLKCDLHRLQEARERWLSQVGQLVLTCKQTLMQNTKRYKKILKMVKNDPRDLFPKLDFTNRRRHSQLLWRFPPGDSVRASGHLPSAREGPSCTRRLCTPPRLDWRSDRMSTKVEIMKGQDGYTCKGYAKRHFLITKFPCPWPSRFPLASVWALCWLGF